MVDLLTRPTRAVSAQRTDRRLAPLTAGLVAGVSAAAVGLIVVVAVVMLAWGTDSNSSASAQTALRVGGGFWLLAHHGIGQLTGQRFGLIPLGLFALPAGLLVHAGRAVARTDVVTNRRTAWQAGAVTVAAYAACVAGVSVGVGAAPVHVALPMALGSGAGLALLAVTAGVARERGLRELTGRSMPAPAAAAIRAGVAAAALIVAAGAVLVSVALALHAHRATALADGFAPGVLGGPLLALLGVVYVPNAAVFGAAYAVGPGFSVGAGTGVSVFGVHLGVVPAFPLLAALPSTEHAPASTWIFLAAPVLAGLLAAASVRRRYDGGRWHSTAVAGAAGVVAGASLAALAALAGGPAGPGHLATIGPSAWQVGVDTAVEVGLVAAAGVLLASWPRAVGVARAARAAAVRLLHLPSR